MFRDTCSILTKTCSMISCTRPVGKKQRLSSSFTEAVSVSRWPLLLACKSFCFDRLLFLLVVDDVEVCLDVIRFSFSAVRDDIVRLTLYDILPTPTAKRSLPQHVCVTLYYFDVSLFYGYVTRSKSSACLLLYQLSLSGHSQLKPMRLSKRLINSTSRILYVSIPPSTNVTPECAYCLTVLCVESNPGLSASTMVSKLQIHNLLRLRTPHQITRKQVESGMKFNENCIFVQNH